MENNLQHISISYIKEVTQGDITIINKILQMFIAQVSENIENLLIALHDKNYEKLRFYAHKAKNDLKVVGMENLAVLMKELEDLAKQGLNTRRFPEIISQYIKDTQIAIDEINKYILSPN